MSVNMLHSLALVSVLGFFAVVGISRAEVFETPDEVAETRIGVKTAFAKHVMEISDLLQMFIALINRADETEGRELGLPDITTIDPGKLESASLEELFDRFETAAQSFRTRFLKYLKSTENPYLRVTPTISTIFELNKGKGLTKYIYEHENVEANEADINSEANNERVTSSIGPVEGDSSNEKTFSLILSDEGVSDSEMETDYSKSALVQEENDPSIEASVAYILSNEEVADSEMEPGYRAFQEAPDDTDSSGDKPLEFILSNEEDLETEASSGDETSDVTVTFVPCTEENADSLVDETTFKPFLNGNFENPELYVTEATLDPEEESTLTEKQRLTQATDKVFNGEATLILQPITEGEEAEIKTETSPAYSAEEITLMPLTTTDDTPEEYTLVQFLNARDDSSEETMGVLSTTEDDDSSEETMNVLSTTEDDDSNEETMGVLSTTEDDDSSEETMGVLSTTEDDDSNENFLDMLPNTEDEDSDDIIIVKNYESDTEATSRFTKYDESSKEMTELIKILRAAANKYDNKEFSKSSTIENISSSELSDAESLHDAEYFENRAKRTLKVPKASIEEVIHAISSIDEDTFAVDPTFLRDSYNEFNSEDAQNRENISGRIGMMRTTPIYSCLDQVIGLPGQDYPNYTTIAPTSFTCEGKGKPGLYADLETRCQVFHACWPQRRESYLCPVGSTFNQQILSCDYWFNSKCSLSQDYYHLNYLLQDYEDKVEDKLYEYLDENAVYPYNFRSEHPHPIFKEMKFLPFQYKVVNYSTKRRGLESGTEIDYNKGVDIEFDKNAPLPTFEDLDQQETTTDLIDSVKDRFRDLVRSFVASEFSKSDDSSDEDSSLHQKKLQERKFVYEKMMRPRIERSGILPEIKIEESLDEVTTTSEPDTKQDLWHKSKQSKTGKEQIASAIVFKALETAENVVNKGILPLTRELLASNYVKLYKKKKL